MPQECCGDANGYTTLKGCPVGCGLYQVELLGAKERKADGKGPHQFQGPLKLSCQPPAARPPAHFFRVKNSFVPTALPSSRDPASTSPYRSFQARSLSPLQCF